jgi:hypothetical protein
VLAPCPHASGSELQLLLTFDEIDRCQVCCCAFPNFSINNDRCCLIEFLCTYSLFALAIKLSWLCDVPLKYTPLPLKQNNHICSSCPCTHTRNWMVHLFVLHTLWWFLPDPGQGPEGFWQLLLLGRSLQNWDWRKQGLCIFLGGDQFNAVLALVLHGISSSKQYHTRTCSL